MLNPTEALYGFLSWIISDSRKHVLGGGWHGGSLHSELAKFCKANNLPILEDGWEKKVVTPNSVALSICKKLQQNE